LNGIELVGVAKLSKGKLAFDLLECFVKLGSAVTEGLVDESLAIQEQKIKSKDTDLDLDIFGLDILTFSRHELLERQDLFLIHVPGDGLTIQNETLGALFDPGGQLGENIWVLL